MDIPLIDLAVPDGEAAARMAAACEVHGFFGVVNHGVPQAHLLDSVAAARRFFALPDAAKAAVARPRPGVNRGYIAPGTEVLARLAGNEAPPDVKEILTFGPDDFPDTDYFNCPDAAPHWVRNLWPQQDLPGFREDVLAYWGDMQTLSRRLTRLCAIALGIAPDFFEPRTDHDPSQLRLIHYPPQERTPLPGQLRAGVHTDLNLLTIVYSDNTIGGLEVQGRDGTWIAAPRFEGFMVNIGDTMMRWCNDRWKSTPHRVANPPVAAGSASDRISLAFFFIANYDALIECVPSCCGPDNPPRYAPITVGEYRAARFARTANT
jgi:isopenicillin N synthase-like dioxygenase